MSEPRQFRPSLRAVFTNFWQPMPLSRKLRLWARNMAVRARTRQNCCGHPGEPGC